MEVSKFNFTGNIQFIVAIEDIIFQLSVDGRKDIFHCQFVQVQSNSPSLALNRSTHLKYAQKKEKSNQFHKQQPFFYFT